MIEKQRETLRKLMVEQGISLREFEERYLKPNRRAGRRLMTRQRLSKVLDGRSDLAATECQQLADILLRSGFAENQVRGLRPRQMPAVAESAATWPERDRRYAQLRRIVEGLPGSVWWTDPGPDSLVNKMSRKTYLNDPEWEARYLQLRAGYDISEGFQEKRRHEVAAILRGGGERVGGYRRPGDDSVAVLTPAELLTQQRKNGELFVFEVILKNTGKVDWCDRLIFRIGPPVTSNLPLAPLLVPVPDAKPGEQCRILVPGRAQHLHGLAVISYVMVFADCSQALPGHLQLRVDTRQQKRFRQVTGLGPTGTSS